MKKVMCIYLIAILSIVLISPALSTTYADAAYPTIESFQGPTGADFSNPDTVLHYTVKVYGGTEPYQYKWMSSSTTIAEGTGESFASQDFILNNLVSNGEGIYIRLYVTDAKGNMAAWQNDKGETSTEFIYGIQFKDNHVVQFPTYPYKEATMKGNTAPILEPIDVGGFAVFSIVSGEVKFRPGDQENGWGFAKENKKILNGYHILTGEDSYAVVSLSETSSFKIDQNTEVVLTFPERINSKLQLVGGTIWINFKKMLKDGTMQVDMSQASLGIKGTTFVCSELGGKSTLKVIDGTVEMTSTINPSTQSVSTGETLAADYNGLGVKEQFDIEQESGFWKKMDEPTSKFDMKYVYGGCGAVFLLIALLIFTKKRRGKNTPAK